MWGYFDWQVAEGIEVYQEYQRAAGKGIAYLLKSGC